VISRVDLSEPVNDAVFAEIHRALLDFAVICFRGQELTREAQLAFARRFGTPDVHPIAVGMEQYPEVIRVLKPPGESARFGNDWHSDNSFFEEPSALTILYGDTLPPFGGDTIWASMERAYDALSEAMKGMLDGLVAVHSASRAYDPEVTGAAYRGEAPIRYTYSEAVETEVEHPVVRTHPETARKGIYVNPMFTQRIVGMEEHESRALLDMLYAHSVRPDFTCRIRWQPGTLTIWDNRCTQHYAMNDYYGHERLMYRITVNGDRPV
jgi:taurine dioxygenase